MARSVGQIYPAVMTAMGEALAGLEIIKAINVAIASIQDSLFVQLAPVSAATVDGTYEYSLGGNMALISGVDVGGESVPPSSWDIIEGTSVLLRFNQAYFDFSATPTYRVHGWGTHAFVDDPTDSVSVDIDYIVAKTVSILHASRMNVVSGELEEDRMRAFHEQEQVKFTGLAEMALQRAVQAQAIPPTARRVRSNMMA